MKKVLVGLALVAAVGMVGGNALAADKVKSKFYDFSEMLIDGEIKKPTALYTDARSKVQFDRLLKLKKSFLESLKASGREEVFK